MEQDKLDGFINTMKSDAPDDHHSPYLKALWYDANGNWQEAHNSIQDLLDKNAAWVHAYLHRKEGDLPNADYWYSKAGKTRPPNTLNEEWETLVKYFLQ
ncbi:MAG: hypothetical protein ABIR81_07955 [Ginsengibacter sp.]